MDSQEIIAEIDREIANLVKAKELLLGTPAKRGPGRPRSTDFPNPSAKKKARRKMSAEGRARIAAAQKARWAKVKAK